MDKSLSFTAGPEHESSHPNCPTLSASTNASPLQTRIIILTFPTLSFIRPLMLEFSCFDFHLSIRLINIIKMNL